MKSLIHRYESMKEVSGVFAHAESALRKAFGHRGPWGAADSYKNLCSTVPRSHCLEPAPARTSRSQPWIV